MYDHELTLLGQEYEEDEWGNQVPAESRTTILCKLKSIGRQEFYAAAQAGMKPELVFVVHAYEYDDQKLVEFEGRKYSIVRTYRMSFEEMELVCSEAIGNV